MRTFLRSIIVLVTMTSGQSCLAASNDIALDTYKCSDFLADVKSPAGTVPLVRSLMMVAWAAGYAAAYQSGPPRAQPKQIQLISAVLGNACRDTPTQNVVDAIATTVKKFTGTKSEDVSKH